MMKVDRHAPGQVLIRDLGQLFGVVIAAAALILGTHAAVWLAFYLVA